MYFSLNYDDGYVVTVTRIWDDGMINTKPLRKFEWQGDAIAFRSYDCLKLSETQIKTLVARYDPNVKYRRLNNGKRFVKV